MIMNLWFPCQHLKNLESIKIIFAQFISFHYINFLPWVIHVEPNKWCIH